jgi:multidrug transporter EmrE-like cation transporter
METPEAFSGLRTAATQGASPQQIPQLKIATNGRNTMRQYAWAILAVAGVFETGFSIGLKYSQGFTRLWPSVATAIMIVLSLGLVGVAMRSLPLGTAYAVWTGMARCEQKTAPIIARHWPDPFHGTISSRRR